MSAREKVQYLLDNVFNPNRNPRYNWGIKNLHSFILSELALPTYGYGIVRWDARSIDLAVDGEVFHVKQTRVGRNQVWCIV